MKFKQSTPMASLVFRVLFFRVLQSSWRRLFLAVLTVALGTALAVAIRLSTQSAKLSLQANLETITQPQWLGPIRFADANAAQSLLTLFEQRTYRLTRPLTIGLLTDANPLQNTQVSIEWNAPAIVGSFATVVENARGLHLSLPLQCEASFSPHKNLTAKWRNKSAPVTLHFAQIISRTCSVAFVSGSQAEASGLFTQDELLPTEFFVKTLTKEDSTDVAMALQNLAAQQPGLQFASPASQLQDLAKLTASLNANLQLMGLISLFVGMFMVHHVFALVVAANGKTLAILKCLGVGTARLLPPLMCLLLCLGIVSALFGNLLGILLGRLLSEVTQGTVSALYDSRISVNQFLWDPKELLIGCALALGACVAGGLKPIAQLRKLDAAEVLRSGILKPQEIGTPSAVYLLLASIVIVTLLLKFPLVYQRLPVGALAACFVLLLASALFAKIVTSTMHSAAEKFSLARPFFLQMRIYFPAQNAIAVQVLAMCFSLTLSVKSMSESFRSSLENWVSETLKADLWIRSSNTQADPFSPRLVSAIDNLKTIRNAKAVDGLRVFRGTLVETATAIADSADSAGYALRPQQLPIVLSAVRLNEQAHVAPLKLIGSFQRQNSLSQEMWQQAQNCMGTRSNPCDSYISQPLSIHANLNLKDNSLLKVSVEGHTLWVRARGYFEDFGNDQGSIILDMSILERILEKKIQPSFMNVYLENIAMIEAVYKKIINIINEEDRSDLEVITLQDLRNRIITIFENTFRITDALYLLSATVSFVAVVCTLGLQTLLRAKEWSILWANGIGSETQKHRSALWAGHLGLWAYFVSLPGAFAIAMVLVYVVNYYSFGFSLNFSVPLIFLVLMGCVAWASGFLGGLLAARGISKQLTTANISSE